MQSFLQHWYIFNVDRRIMLGTILNENLMTILMLGVGTLFAWFISRRPHGIPPGPGPVWPVIGNLLAVGANPLKRFEEWRRKYGDVFSFYIGQRLVVVLNGYDVLNEALVKRGDEFTNRPDMFMFEMISNGILGTSGKVWKEQRRFALSTLRDLGLGRNILEQKINEEALTFLKEVEDQNGQKFDFTDLMNTAVSNIISSIMFGKRYEYNDSSFIELQEKYAKSTKSVGIMAVLSFFSFFKYIPGDLFELNKAQRALEFTDEHFLKPAIKQHIEDYDENNIHDFISAYIRQIKVKESLGEEMSFSYNSLKRCIGDMFVGGAETTATSLRWAVIFLIRNPEIQEKCHQEIKETIGLERLPSMADKLKMPYMEATITEIQRLANVAPFGLFRTVPHNVYLNGYIIPKGAIVVTNLSSVLKDPTLFRNPETFKPERFLDSEGKFVKPDEVIPFSMGKRKCIGESLARMELFLFLTAMIQRFRFEKPEDEDLPSLEAVLGATCSPKCFNFVAINRFA